MTNFYEPVDPPRLPAIDPLSVFYTCAGPCKTVVRSADVRWLDGEPWCKACFEARKAVPPRTPEGLATPCSRCGHRFSRHCDAWPHRCAACGCPGFQAPGPSLEDVSLKEETP